MAAAKAVNNTLIEVEATEEVSEENDTKTKEVTAVEAAIPEKNDKETWEAPDESITNSGGIHAFRSSTPQKPNVQGLSRSYRQNCDQCFHNSVCVDCFVDWHKQNKKEFYRKHSNDDRPSTGWT